MSTGRPGPEAETASERAFRRIDERSARGAGMIADQNAGEAAAELGLRRTATLLHRLGRPQDAFAIVQVAGSKGKGSVSALVAAILTAAGYRTGRATSPHLHRYTERIAIDGQDIGDAEFAAVADEVLEAIDRLERDEPGLGRVNAYEALFAMALVVFRRAGCAVAVVEVGIGGRLDASNVLDPAVSVITTLDLEHTAILGPTIPDIAREKAGIIKPGRPVIVAPQTADAMAVIRTRATGMGSPVIAVGAEDIAAAPEPDHLRGPHQRLNAAVALATVAALGDVMPNLAVSPGAIVGGVASATLPGRFEVVDPDRVRALAGASGAVPALILDGAHTPLAAAALRATIAEIYGPDRQVVAVFGLASDKDAGAIVDALRPDLVVPVAAASPRSVPVATIEGIARAATVDVAATGQGTVSAGLSLAAESNPAAIIVVTGSFSVVAEARVALGIAES